MPSVGTVAAVLRELRERRGLSNAETSRRAGISRATLLQWERGVHAPPGPALERLLDAVRAEPGERAAILAAAAPRHAKIVLAGEALGAPVGRGAILRAMRGRRAMTQGAVAQAMGVTQGAVAKWESGESAPDAETLARLMALLGASDEETKILRESDEATEPLSIEAATAVLQRMGSLPPQAWASFEPLLLACEAEAWRQAARDPRWEPTLVRLMAVRSVWLGNAARRAEKLDLARRTLRLAARCGAWNEAVGAFKATLGGYSYEGHLFPERLARDLARIEAFAPRLRDPKRRAAVEGNLTRLLALEARSAGSAHEAARRLEESMGAFDAFAEIDEMDACWLAGIRIATLCMYGRFDEAADVEAATPWGARPGGFGEIDVAYNLSNRMWSYLRHGVEPGADEVRRYEACHPLFATLPYARTSVSDWHREHDARRRRRYV